MIGILDAGRIAVFLVDPREKRLVRMNYRACALLGYTSDELLGMPVSNICLEKTDIINCCLEKILTAENDHSTNLKLKTKTKEAIATEAMLSTLPGGSDTYVLAIIKEKVPRAIARTASRPASATPASRSAGCW